MRVLLPEFVRRQVAETLYYFVFSKFRHKVRATEDVLRSIMVHCACHSGAEAGRGALFFEPEMHGRQGLTLR